MVYANDKVFGKNLDNFLAGQLSSLSNNINALQADLLNIDGSEVNDYLKSVIKTLNDKKQKLSDTRNEINETSEKKEKLRILKANIPELGLDFVDALRHTDVEQINQQGDIEMLNIEGILNDIEMADGTLDDAFMNDAEIILNSGEINLSNFKNKLNNKEKIDLLRAKIAKKNTLPKKENVEKSFISKRKRNRDKPDNNIGIKPRSFRIR